MNETDTVEDKRTGAQDNTIFSLLHAAHALEDRVEDSLGKAGLSFPKFGVLSELVSVGRPLSLSELAGRLSCVKSNMTQLVDRLEAEGLVKRVDDPNDRRSVQAAITDQGRERQNAGATEVAKVQEEFANAVSSNDRAAVKRILSALG